MRATNIEKHQEELRRRQFEAMAQHFFEKWQPEDPYEAQCFSAELFSLVRQIYIDAAAPQTELISKIISCLPPTLPQHPGKTK